jgi:hypothetical protein
MVSFVLLNRRKKMKNAIVLTLIVGVLFAGGCRQPGMNIKMAAADAGCGIAVVGALEAVPAEKFETTKVKIIEISTDLLGFVSTGNLDQLPLDVVKEKLEDFMIKKGWGSYTYLVDTVVQYVKTQSVDVNIIGIDNVKLIKIGLEEIIRNAKRSTLDGRTKKENS